MKYHAPTIDQLPTKKQLLKSTIQALIASLIILFVFILPGEYGIDPTGAGKLLGLTRMGEIKQQLKSEADIAALEELENIRKVPSTSISSENVNVPAVEPEIIETNTLTVDQNTDSMTLTLVPDAAAEVKLVMKKGSTVNYSWSANGGKLNFDTHGEGQGGLSAKYDSGRNESGQDNQSFVAEFDGTHGWFWRNRTRETVTLDITATGEFSEMKKI